MSAVQIDRFRSNVFAFVSGLNVVGTALVQYDGVDGDATALTATGLGGVSLSGGDANAGLLLATRGDSPGATAVLRVYTNATDFSTTTINIPDQACHRRDFCSVLRICVWAVEPAPRSPRSAPSNC